MNVNTVIELQEHLEYLLGVARVAKPQYTRPIF